VRDASIWIDKSSVLSLDQINKALDAIKARSLIKLIMRLKAAVERA